MSQNIKWALDSEGTLTFTGKGDMPDYDFLDGYGFVNNMSPFANDPYIWDRDTYVKNVVISEGITSVGSGFFCLKFLKTVRLPDSLKSIGNRAFYACNNLEIIRMPASVTSIGTLAFAYCTSLETVNIPKSITSMGTRVFEGTRWLCSKAMDNELVIENGIHIYGNPERDFVVPDEVTYIAGSGIGEIPDYTSKLTSITIPKSVNGISKNAFMDMYSLASINVASDNQAFTSVNGVLFNKKTSSSLTRAQKKPQITLLPTA